MIDIDPAKFMTLASALGDAKLSAADATAIVSVARLAVDADRTEDSDELALYDVLAEHVCKLAGISADAVQDAEDHKPRGDDDRQQRMLARADQLKTKPPRELAYAVAYILTIADLDIAPAEDAFLAALQEALAIDDDRQSEIAELVNEAIAPE
jgi:hypothetical protein